MREPRRGGRRLPPALEEEGPRAQARIRRIVFGLLVLLALETSVFALDAAFPPNLGRAKRSSPVALDLESLG